MRPRVFVAPCEPDATTPPYRAAKNEPMLYRAFFSFRNVAHGQVLGSQILGDTSPTFRLWSRIILGNAGQNHWRTVGKLGDKRKIPAHGLDRFSERGQQQIAPLFEARNTVLGDPERLGHLYLRELARVPQFAQSHLLGDQPGGAGLDFLWPSNRISSSSPSASTM
jgi:hypothetical protein